MDSNPSERVTMDVAEVQRLLGISKDQAYKLCNEGRFQIKKLGRRTLVNRKSFNEWFNNGNTYHVLSY